MSDQASMPTAPLEVPQDPFVGTVISERYRVLGRIGEGGMGAVYRAEHILMKKVVALKLLHPELGLIEDAARRFEREAQSASRLDHPNVIAVTDFGRAPSGVLFLVMEYVPGMSLAAVIEREGALTVERAVNIGRQILAGLEHAHARGIVHRDLKPANIMLMSHSDRRLGEVVKVLDFGIAKMSQVSEGDRPLTQGAMVFGTPSYMSPEQATAQEADARTDVYSCGVMLYEMLTGRKPFIADDLVKVMAMQVTATPPPFSTVAPYAQISSALEAAVMRALEKDRTRRFQSAAELREELERMAVDAGGIQLKLPRLSSLGLKTPRMVARALDRLPPTARKAAPWTLGALVLCLMVLPWICVGGGAAPSATPPPPRPVAPELKIPLKNIEDAIASSRLAEARLLVMQQISAHPKNGRLRFLLGNLEFAEKNADAGLAAYGEALRLDPGLRGDAALLLHVQRLLADRKRARDALDMLIAQVGKPASAILAEIATDDRRQEFRVSARAACQSLGCADQVDYVKSYALDLTQGRTCDERREAVSKLVETNDARAIEPLKKARRTARGLSTLFGGGNYCIRKEIDAGLEELGAR